MRATPTHQAMQFVQIKSAKFPRFDQEFEDSTPDILTLTTLTSFLILTLLPLLLRPGENHQHSEGAGFGS